RPGPGGLSCWSESPPASAGGDSAGPARVQHLRGWAAVGPLPSAAWLDRRRRITLGQVPLQQLPPWLGIDRALVGWQAWQGSRSAVLVADAGTALSLTLVDGQGRFAGGRIQAGLALQLRALASGTARLPALGLEVCAESPANRPAAQELWPTATAEAMAVGVREGLAAAVLEAWRQARARHSGCRLWITGGDGAWIAERLEIDYQPCLALQALARLSPDWAPGADPDLSSGPDR
ncbi:MAG: type III pantothenate kinase, partial [Synechococcaceae cyanobacterium]